MNEMAGVQLGQWEGNTSSPLAVLAGHCDRGYWTKGADIEVVRAHQTDLSSPLRLLVGHHTVAGEEEQIVHQGERHA
jgi:hypothetical protein